METDKAPGIIKLDSYTTEQLMELVMQIQELQQRINVIGNVVKGSKGVDVTVKYDLSQDGKTMEKVNK